MLQEQINNMFDCEHAQNSLTKDKESTEAPQEIVEDTISELNEVKTTAVKDPLPQEEKKGKEFGPLSYHELTGKPDLRPDTFEDIAPTVVYSSSGRAYVGFNDKDKAEEFLNSLSEPAMLGEENTMNDFKFEVKFYCDRNSIQVIADSINSMSEDVDHFIEEENIKNVPNFEKIDGEIIYNHNDSICYVAGRAKGRTG